jgi:transcription elongation factor Elf1
MPFAPCPECRKRKWALRTDPKNFRQRVLHCMECGFEVDIRVVRASRRLLARVRERLDKQPDNGG